MNLSSVKSALYSPVCDTSEKAYLAYLRGVEQYGQLFECSLRSNGSGQVPRRYDSDNHFGGCCCSTMSCPVASAHNSALDAVANVAVLSRQSCAFFSGIGVQGQGDQPTSGVAGCVVGEDVGDLSNSVCDGPVASEDKDSKNWDRKVVGGRGVNYERNKRNREAQKLRKAKRKAMGDDWRCGRKSGVEAGSDRKGYFSDCSSEVQKELRDTRAQLLIQKNKLDLEKVRKQYDREVSPLTVVNELVRVVRAAEQLKKQTKDTAVAGWAATVADSVTKTAAESAPSSVPSLESVGYGKSALKSSDGSSCDEAGIMRQVEYSSQRMQLDKYYDSLEFVDVAEQQSAIADLEREFADVLLSPDDYKQRKVVESLVNAMGVSGIGFQKIQSVVECAGFDYQFDVSF